ncbi:MAG: uracil-DNA glycosylase [Alphaproteobacteria bacterium]|nr:uracil-DNA glycosylase [Alphaproteobacteria bacterium]
MVLDRRAAQTALEWHLDHGVDEALGEEPSYKMRRLRDDGMMGTSSDPVSSPHPIIGTGETRAQAVKLAREANTLDELKEAIRAFDGLAIKKTATNLVFCDGNPKAPVMLVGEAPGADEDRQGKPFVGVSGQLLDKILKYIDLDRQEEDPARAIYISNILNWRPPGNRTPSPAEVEISLPFIEKHIALINPKILILCGGVSAKALMGAGESISRLRRSWHTYKTLTPDLGVAVEIPAIATYHPAYLLRTPSQKRAVWEDMLTIDKKKREIMQP